MAPSLEERTLSLLEWDELLKHLANRASTGPGAKMCLGLKPLSSLEEIQRELSLTSEMVWVMERRGTLPLEIPDGIDDLLSRSEKGEGLVGAELARIGRFLSSVKRVREVLIESTAEAQGLGQLAVQMDELAALREAIETSLDPEGHLLDHASPRLGFLRKDVRKKREEISSRLESYIKSPESGRWLQDSYYTLRDGRFVLPLRADAKPKVQGIVHDVSSSGATLFVEPTWLVDLNNSLRIAELEVQREEKRILDSLSHKVAQRKRAMGVNLEIMARLDCLQAKARLSEDLGGTRPLISQDGKTVLNGLRHPLLVLRNKEVIANDVILGGDARVLVVSGPNAGGKTVFLKALGLCVLMMRAGLHIPAKKDSRISFFSKVFADIGDQQDIHYDFSTFSAHMRNLKEILQEASSDSLILVDEIAGSTDPQEGAALALAFLEEFLRRGSTVVVSTHYSQVKAWAHGTPGVQNGAMEFDWNSLRPTYRFVQGLPGQSSALQIARQMGIPQGLLNEASRKLKGDELTLESLLKEVQQQRKALEEERNRLEATIKGLNEVKKEQDEVLNRLRNEMEEFAREKRLRLAHEIHRARERIKGILHQVAKAQWRSEILQARRELDTLARDVASGGVLPRKETIPLGDVRKGDIVEVVPLGKRGMLLDDLSPTKARVRVQVGRMEILVDKESLGGLVKQSRGKSKGPTAAPSSEMGLVEVPGEIDLRGMRVEEALDELERYLDRALLSPRGEVRIIHGHGTGALKKAVRQWLGGCQWIAGFRPGVEGEGGDGVTTVMLGRKGPENS